MTIAGRKVDRPPSRIVAGGFSFTNEIRFDANEEWLYVAETMAKRVTRLRVQPDGSLTDREIFGPSSLGTGVIDGIAFDAYGNLWTTMILAERLIAITPQGDVLELLDCGESTATAAYEAAYAELARTGEAISFDTMLLCGKSSVAPWMASVTFGGADLSTVYLGSLRGSRIPAFRSPVPGLPMIHW